MPQSTRYIEERDKYGVVIKRYVQDRLLGKGGFAKCYAVVDCETREVLAAKVIDKASLTKPKTKQKLMSEIKIHSMMSHPNLVEYKHCFEDDRYVYILLELCGEKTLMEHSRRKRRFSEEETSYLLWQCLQGLHYMHANAVIHRDLKLSNLLLNDRMEVRIADFGLATQLDYDGERKLTMCGTPNYIAPEILEGSHRGHSFEVDIWTLGVIMYTLLVGKPPFEMTDTKATYMRIREVSYSFPADLPVTPEAKNLVRRILQANPERRPSLQSIENDPFFKLFPPAALAPLSLFEYGSKNYHAHERRLRDAGIDPHAAQPRGRPSPAAASPPAAYASGARGLAGASLPPPRLPSVGRHGGGVCGAGSPLRYASSSPGLTASCGGGTTTARSSSAHNTDRLGSTSRSPVRSAQRLPLGAQQHQQHQAYAGSDHVFSPAPRAPPSCSPSRYSSYVPGSAGSTYAARSSSVGVTSDRGAGAGASPPQQLSQRYHHQKQQQPSASPRGIDHLVSHASAPAMRVGAGESGNSNSNANNAHASSPGAAGGGGGRKPGSPHRYASSIPQHRSSSASAPPDRYGYASPQGGTPTPTLSYLRPAAAAYGSAAKPLPESPAFSATAPPPPAAASPAADASPGGAGGGGAAGERRLYSGYWTSGAGVSPGIRLQADIQTPSLSPKGAPPLDAREQREQRQAQAHDPGRFASTYTPGSAGLHHVRNYAAEGAGSRDRSSSACQRAQQGPAEPARGAGGVPADERDNEQANLTAMQHNLEKTLTDVHAHESAAPPQQQQHTPPVERQAGAGEYGHAAPALNPVQVSITAYTDFTSKYGMAYSLNNGEVGVHYNDNTKMVWNSKADLVQYVTSARVGDDGLPTEEKLTCSVAAYPEELRKKITLISYFKNYLSRPRPAGRDGPPEVVPCGKDKQPVPPAEGDMVYVKRWLKTRYAIIFRLSNKSVQVSFFDGTEILLFAEARQVTYTDEKGVPSTFPLSSMNLHLKPEIAQRLKYTKEIITRLMNKA
ncbi:putative serine/threonine-protein kinase CCRP1 [Diplonema papillatum]|nr:putative serine/threonine-protein kinase CCRP1 [Diplonema papillatum]